MNKSEPIIFIVDDDEAVQQSLSMLVEAVGLKSKTYNRAEDFLDAYDPAQAGCLLLDIRMPGMSGLGLQSKLAAEGINIPIIVITGHGDVPMAVEAVKAGAIDFVEKPFRDQVLLDSIQKAIELDEQNRHKQSERTDVETRIALLTPREREVMDLLVLGKSNKVIAYDLGISQKTVDFHRAHTLEKMEVGSVVELLLSMQKVGLM